jgi:hypothetical protein
MSATTAQSFGAFLKSAHDIMRKDKGLNVDLDRLPMLTWIMFLKFLDDLELKREGEAQLSGKKFQPAILPTAGAVGPPNPTASPPLSCSISAPPKARKPTRLSPASANSGSRRHGCLRAKNLNIPAVSTQGLLFPQPQKAFGMALNSV